MPSVADTFDLQQFINSNEMLDFTQNYPSIRLFVTEKSSASPFTAYNINEADVFFLGTYSDSKQTSNSSVYFDRNYQVLRHSTQQYMNFDIAPYDFAVYPLKDALSKTVKECGLDNEQLTSIAFNHPAIDYDVMIYLFTTQDKSGMCMQSLFDTFHKTAYCKVAPSSCYALAQH